MKKLFIVLMLSAIASISYAGSETGTADDIDVIDFKPSANVVYEYTDDGNTSPQAYSIATKHTSGDRIFASTSATSKVYYLEADTYKGVSLGGTGYTAPAAGDAGASTLENTWDAL